MTIREIERLASFLANQRATRNGGLPIENVLEILPKKLREEVINDATEILAKDYICKEDSIDIEKLAEFCHDEQWSGWMEYLFSKGEYIDDGRWIMPPWAVERWTRQMNTKYKKLSEKEKESDREEARAIIKIINNERNT